MKISRVLPVMVVTALVALAGNQQVDAAETLAEAFTTGEASVAFRYRFEFVDDDGFDQDAEASTLRGRLNFATNPLGGWSLFAEFDYVADVIWDDYNAGAGNTPDKLQYPVVADPTGADLNQAYIQWEGSGGTKFRGGRQRIIFDNSRFIGSVGWRQNEQTYDAVFLRHEAGGYDMQLGYVWQVNRIFGDDVPAGTHDNSTPLVNISRQIGNHGKLVGYYYDIDNEDVSGFSNRTYGLRWAGTSKISDHPVKYTLEYAHQTDAHDQPVDYSADYYRADFSVEIGGVTPLIGIESLGGDDSRPGASFRTPLATLHAFNGWADKFLATPAAGLDDLFVGLKGNLGTWTWNIIYHDFEAESGDQSYGTEFDGSLGRKFGEKYGLLLKGAYFDGDSESVFEDTAKLWLQFTADF